MIKNKNDINQVKPEVIMKKLSSEIIKTLSNNTLLTKSKLKKINGGKQTQSRQYWSRRDSNNMQFGASQLNAEFAVSFPTIFTTESKIINNLSQTSNIKCGALK